MKVLFQLAIVFISIVLIHSTHNASQAGDCVEDSLKTNQNGEMLATLSGDVFQTLAGDNIDAMLWLPHTDLLICGPQTFSYKGKAYELYEIINTEDNEKVSALSLNRGDAFFNKTGSCYKSTIMQPTPFMGNNEEIFTLSDGTVWQVMYEYEYMYEYYPDILICPNKGYAVVNGKKLNVQSIR